MQKLSDDELCQVMERLPNWKLTDGKLVREWEFEDFATALNFVNRVAGIAERRSHHPDIDIRYNRVTLGLVTHDAGGVTAKDTEMCSELDRNL